MKAGTGLASGAYDDAAFLDAVSAVLHDPLSPVDAWGTSVDQTDAWKQKLADDFGVDLEDEDVLLGEDLYTAGSLAGGVTGLAKGGKVLAAKAVAHQAEKALVKRGVRELDEATAAGDALVADARRRGEQRIADAEPRGQGVVEDAREESAIEVKEAQRGARRLLADRPGPRLDPLSGEPFDARNGLPPEEYDEQFGDFAHRDYPKNDGFRLAISEPNTVEVGAVLDRLGEPTGRYLAPDGTPWAERALPIESLDVDLHRYKVMRELPTSILEGPAAKGFGQPGGNQYYTGREYTVGSLVEDGYLKELP